LGTDGGADAGGGDVVLDANGDAMQGAPVLAPHQGGLLLPGLTPGLIVQNGNKRIQGRLQSVYLSQDGLGEFNRRDALRIDLRGQFRDSHGNNCSIRHQGVPASWARRRRPDITLARSNSRSFSTSWR